MSTLFFFNDTATTEIYTYLHTLSLHDALPICWPASIPACASASPCTACMIRRPMAAPGHRDGMTTSGQTIPGRGRNEWRRTAEILLPCLLTLAAQTGLLWLAFTDRIGLLPFACFHLGIVLLVLGWAYTFRRGGRVNRFAMLLAVTGCFFGPLGTLGLAVITPLPGILRDRKASWRERGFQYGE